MSTSTEEYGLAEAKAQLSRLVAQAHDHGIESIINVYNKPAAKIVPIETERKTAVSCRGMLAHYADVSKVEFEGDAWSRAVREHYETIGR